MKTDLKIVRQMLESKLTDAQPTRGLRESIHVQQVADPIDIIQQASERDLAVHSLNSDSTLARRLRLALDRLEDGSYGVCLECGEDIAPKRLKALPWAELCIKCQESSDHAGARKEGYEPSGFLRAA